MTRGLHSLHLKHCRQQVGDTLGLLLMVTNTLGRKLEYSGHEGAATLHDHVALELRTLFVDARDGKGWSSSTLQDRCVYTLSGLL